jgi:hypothetical protein
MRAVVMPIGVGPQKRKFEGCEAIMLIRSESNVFSPAAMNRAKKPAINAQATDVRRTFLGV